MLGPHPTHIRPRDAIWRALRFFYLLWGGMLLISLAVSQRLRIPDFLWNWPSCVRFMNSPLGRAMLFGIGLTMALAALFEAWELVDRLLVNFLPEHEEDR